jgi:hypothetical protein
MQMSSSEHVLGWMDYQPSGQQQVSEEQRIIAADGKTGAKRRI